MKNKKIFVVGDYKTGTGPANVTKEYIRCLKDRAICQKMSSKAFRLVELYINVLRTDIIFCSGYSAQNVYAMKFAKKLGKKTVYLVHGAIEHENRINHAENPKMTEIEMKTFELSDMLLAVSEKFCSWLKEKYPEYENKISYITNGIDERTVSSLVNTDMTKILSIGGGMPRKKIVNICEAIKHINEGIEDKDRQLTLYVIGKEGADTETINSYPFVKNLGLVSSSRKEELFKECGIFIQNSCFETFGLAPVEALCAGMSVLCSSVCGVLDLFASADNHDIIADYEDVIEIASKIEYIQDNPNRTKLLGDIDFKKMSWDARTEQLLNIFEEL